MRPLKFSLNITLDGGYDHTVMIAVGDYGRFAWVYDPDGYKIALWEPKGGE